jgi:predicted PurR-regulated permease PerM
MLALCYVAAEIVLPIVLAFMLSLVLQPAMRALERVHLPRGIAALLIILVLFGTLGGLGAALSGPAARWAQKLPAGIPKLQERLTFLSRPITAFQKFVDQAQDLTQGGRIQSPACDGARPGALGPAAQRHSVAGQRASTDCNLCCYSCSSAVTRF